MAERRDNSTQEGIDLTKLPLGTLLRHLNIGSWVTIAGALAAIFWAGYQTPAFLRQSVDVEEASALKKSVEKLSGENETLSNAVTFTQAELDSAITQVGSLNKEKNNLLEDVETLRTEIAKQTADLAKAKKDTSEANNASEELRLNVKELSDNLELTKQNFFACEEKFSVLEKDQSKALQLLGEERTAHNELKNQCSSDLTILAQIEEQLNSQITKTRGLAITVETKETELETQQARLADAIRERDIYLKRHRASLLTVYTGDGGWQGARDVFAPCGTPINAAFGRAQCNAQNMDYWSLKTTGVISGGQCGHSWFALLCQAK